MNIGTLIKKRRKELNMRQKDLASGICTQAMISKIEGDELNPSMNIVHKIAERLQVPLSYFYSGTFFSDTKDSATHQLINLIRYHLERREYAFIAYLVQSNKEAIENAVFPVEISFFEWIQGILYYYLEKDFQKAINKLSTIGLEDESNSLALEVLHSIGVLYYEEMSYKDALLYFKKGEKLLHKTNDYLVKVKLLFNYSLCLKKLGNIEDALQLLVEGIDIIVKENSLYLLGDFFYQKSLCLIEMREYSDVEENLKIAITIFKLQKNNVFETKASLKLRDFKRNGAK